ncbi:MAG: ATP-binding cassette domain-containing protein [Nostocales cyanobacterium]|nr:MAG: ATP-binding cassette domain-containing protein [Nostocales cyanobacterium]
MYIRKIEIKNLWGNNFYWTLNQDVNVLIGKNGSGKSTILKMLNEAIQPIEDSQLNFRLFDPIDEMIIALENDIVIRIDSENRSITGNKEGVNYTLNTSFVNTFDVVEKSLDATITLLDYQLDKLKLEFVTYQRDLSNKVETILKQDDGESRLNQLAKIEAIYEPKKTFIEIINKLFIHTDKKFNEKEFNFIKNGIQTPIFPQDLSSGEKQILIILLKTLLQDKQPYILSMDEPEISLHIDWQRSLIEHIRQINPNCQIIIATHSPTIFYQGWIEKTIRIEEIKSAVESAPETATIIGKNAQLQGRVEKIKNDFRRFYGSNFTKLYQFNRHIKTYTSFTKDECLELLDFLQENHIVPDVITFTTLISKLTNYPDAKDIFDSILAETYTKLTHVKPNEITLNTLIKKVNTVEEGLELIQNVSNHEKLQLYPDIITFSTLLGKAKNTDEIHLLEEMREYYKIKPNYRYLNKLKFKR